MARKKRMNIADLQAKEEAYGYRLTKSKIAGIILPYSLSIGAFAYILYSNLIIALILVAISAITVYLKIVPQEIQVQYYRRGLQQRNRCLNIITQSMTSPENTVYESMKQAAIRMNGEFKQDLQEVIAVMVTSEDDEPVHQAFNKIEEKYADDVVFTQYFEQLETAQFEGNLSPEIFQDLSNYHNQTYEKQQAYIAQRKKRKKEVFTITAIVFGLCVTLAVSNGYDNYRTTFSYSIIGIIASSIFMVVYIFVLMKFFKAYYDESITTVH